MAHVDRPRGAAGCCVIDDPNEPEVLRIPPFLAKRKKLIRGIGIFISVTSVGMVLFALFMILRNERAHDETRCPYRFVETRTLADGVSVSDEARSCVDGLSEHRWMIQRVGSAPLEIGRRRLSTDAYTAPRYTWTPTLEGTHVRVHVENRGMRPITYREEVAIQGRGR